FKKILYSQLEDDAQEVMDDIIEMVACTIVDIDDVKCIYDDAITKVATVIADTLRDMTVQITTYYQWQIQKEELLETMKEYLIEELD
ncbi:MAG: (p)ppGpp synthetase, partial [Turicibacter sp.]|nr:(p)ppGpp synthetase [Turicibacter sp.]